MQSMLLRAKAFTAATNAVQLTQDILGRAQEIFGELDHGLYRMQKDSKFMGFFVKIEVSV